MDNTVLKKRLNTFKSGKGKLTRVSDEVVLELLRSWENWPGSAADLYRELGLTKMQMVSLIKKGKNLVKSGVVVESEFKEIAMSSDADQFARKLNTGMELSLDSGKVIRFYQVEQLIDFLKKVA